MKVLKKIFLSIILLLSLLFLASCSDKKTKNEKIKVIFYANTEARSKKLGKIIIPSIDNLKKGDLIPCPNDPKTDGAIFKGWYTKPFGSGKKWDFEKDRLDDISKVLYASWEYPEYKITYNLGLGDIKLDENAPKKYTVLKEEILKPATKAGARFLGWTDKDPKEFSLADDGYIETTLDFSSDITLNAIFENERYSISFQTDIQKPGSITIEYLEELKNLPKLKDDPKKGKFLGWWSSDGEKNNGDWGYEYKDGELFRGAAKWDDDIKDWVFTLRERVKFYARWE